MPKFPKNTGFNMRSGNGPLQFKQMGASPMSGFAGTLSGKKDIMGGLKSANELGSTVEGVSAKVTRGPEMKMTKMPKAGETKTPDKLETVKAPEHKPSEKVGWLKRTGMRIQEGVEKVKDHAEKRYEGLSDAEKQAKLKDDFNMAAGVLDTKGKDAGRYSTDNLEKHKASKKADELHAVKMENVERNQLETDLMNKERKLRIDAKEAENALKVPASTTAHVDLQGKPNFSSPVSGQATSSSRKAQAQIAADKEWIKKESEKYG